LLQLKHDADATREIARTLGRLIRNIQQGGPGS
jgi:hypothetical protein